MGLFDIFRPKRAEGAVTLEELITGNSTMTVKLALQVPAVAWCVNMIASAVAMLPVKLYRKSGDEVEEITDDPRVMILNGDTGDTMNADNMRRRWVYDYLLRGSAFGYIGFKYGVPDKLIYIPENVVSVLKSENDYIRKRFSYMVNGEEILPYRMLKILRNSDGFGKGVGIVEESPLILETMFQLLKFQKNQVLKGGNKRGFLQSKGVVSPETQESIKKNWANIYSDDMNINKVMFLNGEVDFKEMSASSVEMQVNENVKTNDTEIMRLFGTLDGILSKDTVKNAVMPVLDAFEAAFDSDLLLEKEKADHYFAFDTKELTRGDMGERFSAYGMAIDKNIMQIDEVRKAEDLPPLGFNYIKLGLQDVLLNPETGEVYTPNTNATANMNALGKIGGEGTENVPLEQEDRAKKSNKKGKKTNYKQNPTTGLMEGSESTANAESETAPVNNTDTSKESLDKSEEKDYNNNDDDDYYEFISASGPNEFDFGFSSYNLSDHWYGSETIHSHKAEYEKRGMDMKQYGERALELVQMPTSKTVLGYKDKDGCVIRYDTVSKDFVKGHPKKGIKTMFEAELSYYERQKQKDLEE